jgi:hypothetical protein
MVVLRAEASDQELLSVADRWVDCLAAQDYSAAMALTAHDEYYGWTPDLIRGVIEGYGLPDPHPRGPFRSICRSTARGAISPRPSQSAGVPEGLRWSCTRSTSSDYWGPVTPGTHRARARASVAADPVARKAP